MQFRYEKDGSWTGDEIKNSEPLAGEMKEQQIEYFARKIAADTMDTAERRGYGLGECGYYFYRDAGDLIDSDLATPAEATKIYHRAQELAEQAEDARMTINADYSNYYENERRVQA